MNRITLTDERNADFAAAAREGYPAALDCMEAGINGLALISQSPFLNATESGEIAQGDADAALIKILDRVEKLKTY